MAAVGGTAGAVGAAGSWLKQERGAASITISNPPTLVIQAVRPRIAFYISMKLRIICRPPSVNTLSG